MSTVETLMTALKAKGTEQYRKTYARHGMDPAGVLGVSSADMKALAKTIKGQQKLALELYATGVMEAMYLAGIVADGSLMTKEQLNAWAEGASFRMISENTIAWVASESPFGRELAMAWIASKEEHVAAAGWTTYSALVTTKVDSQLDFREIEGLLDRAVAEIVVEARDRVKSAMNSFVIAVGSYVKPLSEQAKASARRVGPVSVDVGDTACKVPAALSYIEKIEAAGKAGAKRKTVRC